ncbi:MAG: hypothetical protein LWX54_17140 [Deltaproteobacteria bacterium]|jgi:hypothetical protein|nr:hypothetical protein [Deltaproteobacteria bacterium]
MSLLSTIKKESLPDSWDLKSIGTILNNSQYGTNEASADDGNIEIGCTEGRNRIAARTGLPPRIILPLSLPGLKM